MQDVAEIKEVLNYINQLKTYEMDSQKRMNSSISLMWGILFLIGGIFDFMLMTNNQNFLSPYIWVLVAFGGISFSVLNVQVFGQDMKTEEGKNSINEMKNAMISIFAIMTISITFFIFIFLSQNQWSNELNPPFILFVIGTVFLVLELQGKNNDEPKNIHWIICYGGTIVSLILYYGIGNTTVIYFGLIMGLTLGGLNILSFVMSTKQKQDFDTEDDYIAE